MLWLPRKIRRFLLLHDLPVWFKNRIADFDDGWWESQESGPAKEKLEHWYSTLWQWGASAWKEIVVSVIAGLLVLYLAKRLGL